MRVIGTAGHVDHGKSTLIRALTGIDPDRLQEEKERGMTIDLGFAWLRLPNGVEVSIVDVPGHERFVHNMLAGVGGIDIALLVIAADEGVMPQTREHVAILDLLGVSAGVVVLTKCDLVDEDWLDLVEADVEEFLSSTTLAGAPIQRCSAVTGAGLDRLVAQLERQFTRERGRPSSDRPRLAIDRVFTVAGFGTVVTGTLVEGEIRLGQELEVQPGGLRTRVRGLQTHRKKLEAVPAGTRAAVNLGGVAVTDLRRGQVLCLPGALHSTRAADARLRLIASAPPLRHNAQVTFHAGADETVARVALLDADEIQPGDEAWVQMKFQDPVALARGDLFVIRLPSPSTTIGGGRIVEPHARRHRRRQPALLRQLDVFARGTPEQVVLESLRAREPIEVDGLVRRSGLDPGDTRSVLGRLVETNDVVLLDRGNGSARLDGRSFVVSASGWSRLTAEVRDILTTFHADFPLRSGLPKEQLRNRLRAEPRLFTRELDLWLAQGLVVDEGPLVRLSSHSVAFSAAEQLQIDTLLEALRQAGASPPDRTMLEAELGISAEVTDALLAQSRLVEITPGLVFERATLDKVVARIKDDIELNGPRTVAQVRDLLGASRKFALALVIYTDEHHITRRVGDERVLYTTSPRG
jgi:selenocysteine-specific elongation factor